MVMLSEYYKKVSDYYEGEEDNMHPKQSYRTYADGVYDTMRLLEGVKEVDL